MSNFEGDYMMRAVSAEIGGAGGQVKVRVEMEVVEGDRKGSRARYDGKLDEKNIKWTKRAMVQLGWQGKDSRTFVEDVKKAAKVLPCTVRIAEYTYPDSGKTTTWSAVDRIGGGVSKPLERLDDRKLDDVNQWFASAEDVGAGGGADDSDIPF